MKLNQKLFLLLKNSKHRKINLQTLNMRIKNLVKDKDLQFNDKFKSRL